MTSPATTRREPAPVVIEVSEATFQQDVVERSQQAPVVIDFWAPWCGPCRTLGPILEKLANEANGAWTLAKVNVDENPRLAQAFRVQGIPAVKAVSQGKLVDEFTGALPESRVRAWLKGFVAEGGPVVEEDLAAMEQTNPREAIARYRAALAQDPTNGDAALRLGRVLLLHGDAEGAMVLGSIREGSPQYATAQTILPLAEFLELGEHAQAPSEPGSSAARYQRAAVLACQSNYAEAMDTLLEIVARDRSFGEDGARKTLLALLAILGDEHPLVGTYRRKLANALF